MSFYDINNLKYTPDRWSPCELHAGMSDYLCEKAHTRSSCGLALLCLSAQVDRPDEREIKQLYKYRIDILLPLQTIMGVMRSIFF